jgi:hypothetical protein
MTVAQTLGVVHGLVNNMKVVMEGAQPSLDSSLPFSENSPNQMARYRQTVFDRLWVRVFHEVGIGSANLGV